MLPVGAAVGVGAMGVGVPVGDVPPLGVGLGEAGPMVPVTETVGRGVGRCVTLGLGFGPAWPWLQPETRRTVAAMLAMVAAVRSRTVLLGWLVSRAGWPSLRPAREVQAARRPCCFGARCGIAV